MAYPTSVARFKIRYPNIVTTLSTSLAASTDPASTWTYDQCADILVIRRDTGFDIPEMLVPYQRDIERQFEDNHALFAEITAYPDGEEMCISPEAIYGRTPKFAGPFVYLSFALQNPPQISADDHREPSTRPRVPVAREGFVQDMSMFDSDPISSEKEIPHDMYTVRADESGKQEITMHYYGLAWLIEVDLHYSVGLPNPLPRRRPQFMSVSCRIPIYIPGADLRSESRDDCGAYWRGPDMNRRTQRMTTLYMPTVLAIEAKSRRKDALPQWAAELVGQMSEAAGYSKMDCNDPASIAKLTAAQRTKYVLSIQGLHWQWVWATFSVDWILAFFGRDSSLGKRPRVGDPASESDPELPGSSQEEDSQDQLDDEDAMSGVEVEVEHAPIPYLIVNCSREYVFTEPSERFKMLVSTQAALRFGWDTEFEKDQAHIPPSP